MITKGIRGAITVSENSPEAIGAATIKLLKEIVEKNNIETNIISHAIFTLTKDLNADFPAKYARLECGFSLVPMMCYFELDVPNSLEKCLRILLTVNTNKTQEEIKHIYLKGASALRGDLK